MADRIILIIVFVCVYYFGQSLALNLRELCTFNVNARYINSDTINITWSRENRRCGTFVHIRANDARRRIIRLRRNGRLVNEERVRTERRRFHLLKGVRNAGFVYFICSPTCDLLFQFNNQRPVRQLPPKITTTTTVTTSKQRQEKENVTTKQTTPRTTTLPYIPPYPQPAPQTVAPTISTTIDSTSSSTFIGEPRMEGSMEDNDTLQVTWPTTGILIGSIIGVLGLTLGGVVAVISYRKNKKGSKITKGKLTVNRMYEDLQGQERPVYHSYDKPDVIVSSEKRVYQNEHFNLRTATLPGEYEYAQDVGQLKKKDYISPVYRQSEVYDDVAQQRAESAESSYEALTAREATPTLPYDKLKVQKVQKKNKK